MVDRTGATPHFAPDFGEPTFDTLGGAVQQPGTTRPGEPTATNRPHALRPKKPAVVQDSASDKFGVVTITADQAKGYQLLPVDLYRKSAVFIAYNTGMFFGDEANINNALGATGGTYPMPIGVIYLPAGSPAFKYTCKQGLYVCSATPGTSTQVQCMVERFESGTPVT